MRLEEINIRDPFVLVENGSYYQEHVSNKLYFMYGTRGATCWTKATGFDCYVSSDMKEWDGPFEVFHKPEEFWADKNCWAPEVYKYKEEFYMFATFKDSKTHGGTAILKSDSPLGPFKMHSDKQITPNDWECLDGTFYLSNDGIPYMVFVHEWVQITDGEICAVRLSDDLKSAVDEPKVLFRASEAGSWIKPYTNEKYPQKNYVADGPFLYRTNGGKLMILWSSFGEEGYTEAIAFSDNGEIDGKWIHQQELLFKKDGGHGMVFQALDGERYLTLHIPNVHLEEHPMFYRLKEINDTLCLT
ncbi:MAG TPA: family 43 glycosylhydrolase [Clostridiales bacterium]|nr:family 43 glycosylhydrolase [Clostridiales bacterium]